MSKNRTGLDFLILILWLHMWDLLVLFFELHRVMTMFHIVFQANLAWFPHRKSHSSSVLPIGLYWNLFHPVERIVHECLLITSLHNNHVIREFPQIKKAASERSLLGHLVYLSQSGVVFILWFNSNSVA